MAGQLPSLVPYSNATIANNADLQQIAQTNPSYSQAAQAQIATNNANATTQQQAAANQAAAQQAAAAAAAKAAAQANLNTGINNAMSGGQGQINSYQAILGNQGLGVSNAYRAAILGDNTDRENINMNKLASLDDLTNTIRQGLNTAQLGMGNGNAMASSGAEGAARAYSEFGAHGANTVNGQANLGLAQDTSKDQEAQQQMMQGLQQLDANKQYYLNQIQLNVKSALDTLATQAQQAGLSPVDVAGRVNQILGQGQAAMDAIDGQVQARANGMPIESNSDAAIKAQQQYQQGFQPTNGSLFSFGLTPATNPLFTANNPTGSGSLGAGAGLAPITALPLFTKDQSQPVV